MIEARGLAKRYGPMTAVDHLSFDVRPGTVTGFLGPNGAGKLSAGSRSLEEAFFALTEGSIEYSASNLAYQGSPS
jgi:ABC-type multidrug transport system ATPase subunit